MANSSASLNCRRQAWTRSYRARAYGNVTQAQPESLMMGIEIEAACAMAASMQTSSDALAPMFGLSSALQRARTRRRRVLEHLGSASTICTSYGPFVLGDLPAGGVDEVKQHELVAFRKSL